MASEVTSDLNFEPSGPNNLCSSASLASILLYSTNVPRRKRRRGTKLICRLALLCMLVKSIQVLPRHRSSSNPELK